MSEFHAAEKLDRIASAWEWVGETMNDHCDACLQEIKPAYLPGLTQFFPGGALTELGCIVCRSCLQRMELAGVTLNPQWVAASIDIDFGIPPHAFLPANSI